MKRSFLFLLSLLPFFLHAQVGEIAAPLPVKWTVMPAKDAADKWSIIFRADVQEGWFVYSQHMDPNCLSCPIPTLI
ncbi:MAG TPA: hypothetical protein VHL57_07650, partial [Flavobacteriales bacterium]|nr:hypothetical protein [Flavobacteriales bacterium]